MTVAVVLACAIGVSACGGKDKKPGQSLASVNGEDITVMQLNEEMARAGVPAGQQAEASKRLLESLIDRQLLQGQAVQEKLDRDPKVVQAMERAKSLILVQAYMQKKLGEPTRPSKEAVSEYYNAHAPQFAQRKQFDMRQLVFASKDMDPALKAEIDSAKSLEEVAAWMENHKLRFVRNQISRTSADLPEELASKLLSMPKGQLFIIKEGERSVLVQIAEIKDAATSLDLATPQIEQVLAAQKSKQTLEAEVARLRAAAKIEYLNQEALKGGAAPAAAAAPGAAATDESNARGVAGLK